MQEINIRKIASRIVRSGYFYFIIGVCFLIMFSKKYAAGIDRIKSDRQLVNSLPEKEKEQTPKTTLRNKIVNLAKNLRGIKYRYGGNNRSGFDCSGFTQYVFTNLGRSIPRTVKEQVKRGKPVDRKNLQKGDLIFFHENSGYGDVSHVGIVVSDKGKPVTFIHASESSGIKVDQLAEKYYSNRYYTAKNYSF